MGGIDGATLTMRRWHILAALVVASGVAGCTLSTNTGKTSAPAATTTSPVVPTPTPVAETATPSPSGRVPPSGSQTVVYLVAPEGGSGPVGPIGCGDYLVPVEFGPSPPTNTFRQIAYALSDLFSIREPFYGQSGLYNPLYQSSLSVQSVTIDDTGHATVNLSGNLVLGGECDGPRVQAQIEDTALQFSITDVMVFLNGRPLADALSGQGS
jgi:hypothetical protein